MSDQHFSTLRLAPSLASISAFECAVPADLLTSRPQGGVLKC